MDCSPPALASHPPLQVRLSHHLPPQRGTKGVGRQESKQRWIIPNCMTEPRFFRIHTFQGRKDFQKPGQYLHFADRNMLLELKIPSLRLFIPPLWLVLNRDAYPSHQGRIFKIHMAGPHLRSVERRGMMVCAF